MGSRKKTLALHCDKTTSQPAGNSERMWQKFWHSYTSGVANQVEGNLPAIPCAGLAAAIPCAAGLAAAAGLGIKKLVKMEIKETSDQMKEIKKQKIVLQAEFRVLQQQMNEVRQTQTEHTALLAQISGLLADQKRW